MNETALERFGLADRIDRAIATVAPAWAMRRMAARSRMAQAEIELRRFEAASVGRRTRGWNTSNGSANAESLSGLSRLRSRSRDLVRNNAWANRAVGAWADAIVGTGIVPTFHVPGAPALGDRIGELWKDWAGGTACDPERRTTFYGMQHLAAREIVEAGEVLARFRVRRERDGLLVPLQIQPLEADHLDDLKTSATDTAAPRMIQGVEYGPTGGRNALWLFKDHPGEVAYPVGYQSNRVPIDQVLHPFRPDRIGQARGIPWGAPCLLTIRDFDSYADAQLMRQRIAAMFVGFVVGGDNDDLESTAGTPGDATESDGIQDFEPGTWEHLPLGRDVRFSTPPKVDDFLDYSRVTLRQVATGYGIPYEVLSGDLSSVNFHSGRLGRVDWGASVAAFRTLFFLPQFCDPVARRFVTVAMLRGLLPEQATTAEITWTPPAPPMVEPGRETRAHKDAIRAGLTTRSAVIRQLGQVPAQVFRERAEEEELLRELGLVFDDTPIPPDPDEEPEEEELEDQEELEEDDELDADEEAEADRKRADNRQAEIDLERDPA